MESARRVRLQAARLGVPKWSDFGSVWSTLRELDVASIRDESERPLAIVCVGHDTATSDVVRLLHQGPQRYPLGAPSPITVVTLGRSAQVPALTGVNLLIVALDARQPLRADDAATLNQLEALPVPALTVLLHGPAAGAALDTLAPATAARAVRIEQVAALDAPDLLATALLERLPEELQLAAARRLPGLRAIYARQLIATSSFSNATYALASGLPEQIPILSVPFAAADILVLTKNQAVLVYRLALAYGAPPDFQARIREVLPVVGGAFLWRQAARSLIGLIPVWGLIPKVAIAYAGTYPTGVAAWRWYEGGELVSSEQLKRISSEALALGRARAAEIVDQARKAGSHFLERTPHQLRAASEPARGRIRGALSQVRQRLPFRRRSPSK
jgi:uncharacterized protein (DUF697 family)